MRDQFGNLGKDRNLMTFFQAVLERREDLEKEDRVLHHITATVAARSVLGDRDRLSQPGDDKLLGLKFI